jgi:hypothetical protein
MAAVVLDDGSRLPKAAGVVTIRRLWNTISGRARSVGGVGLDLTLCAEQPPQSMRRGPLSLRLSAPIAAVSVGMRSSQVTRCPPSEAAGAGFAISSPRCRDYRSLTKMLSHPRAPDFTRPSGLHCRIISHLKTPVQNLPWNRRPCVGVLLRMAGACSALRSQRG